MRSADLWAPFAPLGEEGGARLERALGGSPVAEVEGLLVALGEGAGEGARAALLAGRFSLSQRSGGSTAEGEARGREAQGAFERLGDGRAAAFLQVERAAGLLADKALLPEAGRLLDAIAVDPGDRTLGAAVARVQGAVARARADLRGSLLHLERARGLAEDSGHPREIIRTFNTLGTSYAALGVASLAREALERARELAELAGQRQSAAIAAGQLAVLALDAERPQLSVRHLELQRVVCERLGDLHGQARALSLLVEAHNAAHELARARDAAEQCRSLHARAPGVWTRMQAALATLYEAEGALAGGDEVRAAELLRSCEEERNSEAPTFRVARARGALSMLWVRLRDDRSPDSLDAAVDDAFSRLSRSPRPTWVERALSLAIEAARRSGRPDLISPLAVRSASLVELRAAAASGALVSLRELAPAAAVARAMATGRQLVLEARLALGPLAPFEAEFLKITTDDDPASIDAALAAFEAPARPGELPDGLLASAAGPACLHLALTDRPLAARAAEQLAALPGVRSVQRSFTRVHVAADPASPLCLVARLGFSLKLSGPTHGRAWWLAMAAGSLVHCPDGFSQISPRLLRTVRAGLPRTLLVQ